MIWMMINLDRKEVRYGKADIQITKTSSERLSRRFEKRREKGGENR